LKNRCILAVLAVLLLAGLSPLTADSRIIHRGVDVFTTPADGRTYYDFAQSPIPAGFFCEASKAFTGRVAFKGLPLATGTPGQLGGADTVIERLDDAVFDAEGIASTRIRFRALSLVSIAPIKTACGAFHVYVSLGGKQRMTPMTLHQTQENGGSFVAPLAVDARLSFIPVKAAKIKSSRPLTLAGSFTFPASPIPWSLREDPKMRRIGSAVVDTNGDLTPDTLLPGTSGFSPGQSPARLFNALYEGGDCPCTSEPTCHAGDGEEHCYYPSPPPGCPDLVCW
jgi:hypothetical protein